MSQIKLRRDTSVNFTTANPVLGSGEPAYETDTKKLKIGDGTTAYADLAYFAGGGGGGTDISASLPLVIEDGVLKLQVDGQTIQVNTEGQLSANLDELGNEVNTIAGDVTALQADILTKEDKFTATAPLVKTASLPATELELQSDALTYNSNSGVISLKTTGTDVYARIDLSNVHLKVHRPYTLHLRAARYATTTSGNSNFFRLQCFNNGSTYRGVRVWNGSGSARAGATSTTCKGLQLNSTDFVHFEFRYDGINGISDYKGRNGSETSTTSLAIDKYTDQAGTYTNFEDEFIELLLNCYSGYAGKFDLANSYFEQDGTKYILKDIIDGTSGSLSIQTGDGLSVVDGKLTAVGSSGDVTANGDNTFTGTNTFNNYILFDCTTNEYNNLGFRAKYTDSGTTKTLPVFGGQLGNNKNLQFGIEDALLRISGSPIQFSEVPKDLSGHTFLTTGNVKAYITETYINGTSGYRLYNDNFIMQWGQYSISSTTGTGEIIFLKPFKDSNYSIYNCKASADASTWNVMFDEQSSWTPSSVGIKSNLTGYNLTGCWYACGYIAEEA